MRRTDAEKAMFQTLYERLTRWSPNSTFKVSDVHQTVNQIAFREDDSL